jgi:hypothetical protein
MRTLPAVKTNFAANWRRQAPVDPFSDTLLLRQAEDRATLESDPSAGLEVGMRWEVKIFPPSLSKQEHPDTKALNSNCLSLIGQPVFCRTNHLPFPSAWLCFVRDSSIRRNLRQESVFAVGFAITVTASQGLE